MAARDVPFIWFRILQLKGIYDHNPSSSNPGITCRMLGFALLGAGRLLVLS